jgi:hypothetical protein
VTSFVFWSQQIFQVRAFLCLEDDILPNKNVLKQIRIMGVYIQAIYYC